MAGGMLCNHHFGNASVGGSSSLLYMVVLLKLTQYV